MSGWIKIHRSITDHWLYTEKRKFSKFEAWNDILLNVNFAPGKTIIKGKIILINRGESILSLESWGKRWKWDKSSVKRFFDLLKKDNMIELKNETVTTRLTVCKYDDYQSSENDIETQTKRKRNANETHVKPIKEEEEKEEEKEVYIHPLCNWIKNDLQNVYSLKSKLTNEQAEKLINDFSKESIQEILESMENKKELAKSYSSVNLTIRSWIKIRQKTEPNYGIKGLENMTVQDDYYLNVMKKMGKL